MKKFLFFLLFCFAKTAMLLGQTTLDKGDIVVVGMNASTGSCSGISDKKIEDIVYILTFKDITRNTVIDITDNAWQRKINNRFGNNEGAVRFIRTGNTIPKGTIFQLNFTIYSKNYDNDLTSANSGWNVSSISVSPSTTGLNFAVKGDQLLFMTDGMWNNGDTSHNAQYLDQSGKKAKIIFGFNSTNVWKSLADTSDDSALPGEEGNDPFDIKLHHYTAKGVAQDYRRYQFYDGSWSAATKEEWYMRILNPSHWRATKNCSDFNDNLSNSPIEIRTSTDEIIACKDDLVAIKVDDNSIVEYQWYSNTVNSTVGGTLIDEATSATYNPPTNVVGTRYYYCVMKYKLEWNNGSRTFNHTSDPILSLVFKVTVNQVQTSPINKID